MFSNYILFLITMWVTIFDSHSIFSYENQSQTKSERHQPTKSKIIIKDNPSARWRFTLIDRDCCILN